MFLHLYDHAKYYYYANVKVAGYGKFLCSRGVLHGANLEFNNEPTYCSIIEQFVRSLSYNVPLGIFQNKDMLEAPI